jgi:hypothetical protein
MSRKNSKSVSSHNNRKIATGSFNYAGYAVTYTLSGYIILFVLICLISFQLATLVVFGGFTGFALFVGVLIIPFVISVLLMKFLNRFVGSMAARFCFLQKRSKVLALKNLRLFSLFLYFKFFYDCFAGIAFCLWRILKALLLGVLFMTRLDYSLMSRPFERMDTGFMYYLSFVQWESTHTNPLMIGFCELLKRESKLRVLKRKEKRRFWTRYNDNGRARTRWFLAYTLIKNRQLVSTRKKKI